MSRETFQSLRMLLMEKLDLARELTDEEILEEIDTLILERMRDSCLSLKEKVQLRQELFHSVRKLDVLQELIEDETVTEIMVNGPDAIFEERATTFPSRSIRNFVKFHLISGVLRKSGWVRYNPLSSSGVRGWFGSNPPKPFCSFRYLYSGCVFSPFTSILEKSLKVIPNFASQKDAISSVVPGAWFPN